MGRSQPDTYPHRDVPQRDLRKGLIKNDIEYNIFRL